MNEQKPNFAAGLTVLARALRSSVSPAGRRLFLERHNTMKNETKHTPGPWQVGRQDHVGDWQIQSGAEGGYGVVACTMPVGIDNPKANARLIAAAPELLDALISVRDLLKYGAAFAPDMQKICAAALAKATGPDETLPHPPEGQPDCPLCGRSNVARGQVPGNWWCNDCDAGFQVRLPEIKPTTTKLARIGGAQ